MDLQDIQDDGDTGLSIKGGELTGQSRLNRGNPGNRHSGAGNRRSGESRNPGNPTGKERTGYRWPWIPAFAGTTVAWVALAELKTGNS